ncbi:MAG: hypothetical protein J7K30_16230 [Deltaproteobacteria bacterium]|nr:hypothetical protein [Deltaproteobacteria bacterium]
MDQKNGILLQKGKDLHKIREKILALPPEKALDAILESEHPSAVVQSFQEDDFYFLINDIGLNDAVELLSLASTRQWEYILDIETWDRDRIDLKSVTQWIHALLTAAPKRLIQWLRDKKKELIEFYIFKNLELKIREHDQEPSELGDGFFTDDDTFYVKPRFNPYGEISAPAMYAQEYDSESIPSEHEEMERSQTLLELIKHLSAYDHILYQQILLESASILPAEVEEEEYRFRNVRLAEKGFLPFEEAIGIYTPLKPKNIEKLGQKIFAAASDKNPFRSAPQYPLSNLKIKNIFTQALQTIESDEVIEHIQQEFAGLANQIISADQKPVRIRADLRKVVEKACGYLNIGLESLSRKLSVTGKKDIAAYIKKYPLALIFRIGYSSALELKWRADRWLEKSWFAGQNLPLPFWGEEWTGLLGGLLIKKPLFYDNYKSGVLYREFFSTEEIAETAEILSMITNFDDIFSKMDVRIKLAEAYEQLDYKNLILTLWCNDQIDSINTQGEFLPVDFDKFKPFFDDLWEDTQETNNKQKQIKLKTKESFLNWLSGRTGMEKYDLYTGFGLILEKLFSEIEAEYGRIATKDLDHRYVRMFLFE